MTDNGIASIVRSLAEGVDPGRVLRDVAQEAMTCTATSHVLLAAMLEGQLTPIVAIGSPQPAMFEAGQESHASGRPPHGMGLLSGFQQGGVRRTDCHKRSQLPL